MHKSITLILVVLVLTTARGAQANKILIEVGKLLGTAILEYPVDKALDKLLGIDCETRLKEVEASLVAQLRRGAGDTHRLQVELEATRSQLRILQALLNSKPTSDQLEQFRHQLVSDLAKVVNVQQEQGQKLKSLEARIKKLEEKESVGALNAVEEKHNDSRPSYRQDSPPLSGGDDLNYKPRAAPQPRRRARNSGVTLMVRVDGQSNEIDVSETEQFEGADIGSFEIEGMRGRYSLRLLADTGGVINIQGDDNTLHLPSYLCGRVRVIRRGGNNRVDGCN